MGPSPTNVAVWSSSAPMTSTDRVGIAALLGEVADEKARLVRAWAVSVELPL